MKLSHFAARPIRAPLIDCTQADHPSFKPFGFWVSVDGGNPDWKEWCDGEEMWAEQIKVRHRVELKPGADILVMSHDFELEEFTEEFGTQLHPDVHFKAIDWARVAEKYSGIIIAPYIWSKRMDEDTFWYYPWDCASGCIWDVSAIDNIKVIEGES